MLKKILKNTVLLLLCAGLLCTGVSCRKKAEKEVTSSSTNSEYNLKAESDWSDIAVNNESGASVVQSSSNSSATIRKKAVKNKAPSDKAASVTASPEIKTVQTNEMRAVWITYLEFDEMLKNKSESQFKKNITKCFENCQKLGLNTVIVQVRSHGDALYKSSFYPTSTHFTGTRKNTASFDPLAVMVNIAHSKGLKIHAWINPLRGPKITDALAPLDPFATYKNTDRVFVYNNYYYLNPAYGETLNLIINGVKEVVSSYNIDGVHFDDRFYPTSSADIDKKAYENLGGGKDLGEWRRQNITNIVRQVYVAVKGIKNIPFGVSPQGNMDNNFYGCFADVPLWCENAGYIDYIAPQLYWAYNEGKLPYEKALSQWENLKFNSTVKLVVGLAPYKVGTNQNWSEGNVLCREIADARKANNYLGFSMYRYNDLISSVCAAEYENLTKMLH